MSSLGRFYLIPPESWLFATHGKVVDAKRRAERYERENGSYEGAEFVVEEFVRQWVLAQLLKAYGYPFDWLGDRILIEEPVNMDSSEKEAAVSIKNSNRKAFLYVETQRRGAPDGDFAAAERRLEIHLASTPTATIGMVTDGERVKTLRKKREPGDFEYIADLPAYGLEPRVKVRLVREQDGNAVGEGRRTGLKVLHNEYERVLSDCHSAVRDADGLHADEALDEICKVIFAKIFDERSVIRRGRGTPFRFRTYGASNASEVASNIRVLYEEARAADTDVQSKRIPGYERSRSVFKGRIKVSDAALYRLVGSLQEFSLIDSKADIKGRAFQRILSSAIRAGMGQYFTPDPIVELAIGVVQPKASDLILDPFCGSGHFLTRASQFVMENERNLSPQELQDFKFCHLHGIEKSDRMVRIAMTDLMLHDDGYTNIRNQDALLSLDNYPDVIALRKDGKKDPGVFDVIVTNPPFGSLLKQEMMEVLGRFELGHKKSSLPLEVLGLERSFQFLKPGGKLAIVLPEHLMKGKNSLFVREWLYGVAHVRALFFFPEEAFAPFGAMVKTCLCLFQKLRPDENPKIHDETFLCDVENLGYDATGRPKPGCEVRAAIAAFHEKARWQ